LAESITNTEIANNAGITYPKLNLDNSITDSDISNAAAITYAKLDLTHSIQETDLAPGVLSNTITTGDIENGSVTIEKLNLAESDIPYTTLFLTNQITNDDIADGAYIAYTKLELAESITNTEIANNAGITYTKLNLVNSITDLDISNAAAITYAKLDLTHSIQETDLAPGVLSNTITTGDIENGSVTIEKLNLASNEIPYTTLNLSNQITNEDISDMTSIAYTKLDLAGSITDAEIANGAGITYTKLNLTNSIDSTDIKNSSLNLNNLTTNTFNADTLFITDTTIIEGNTIINNNLLVTGTTYANTLSITDIAVINGETTINDNLAVTGTTIIDGQTDILNDLNVSGNASINGTVTSTALTLSQYILFTDGLYENKLVLESLSGWNSLTIPDMTGKLVAVQSDGTNGQALVADGLGSYTWQTLETSSDVNYTSVTASKADFDDLTVNNTLVLYNSENPAGQILMSTSAALPQQITIPDISGTVVVTKEQGTNGQAIVSDGSGGYTWQTLNNGLTHEITVGDGGDYNTITEAIDSITDNNILNHYVIKVSPGIFEEQITMKEYVEIKGSGKNATIIKSVGSDSGVYTAATVIGGNDTAISNLSIHCMTSANYAVGIYNSGDSLLIDNLIIIVMTSSVSAETYGIYQYSGSTAISNVGITSSVAGVSGNCFGIYFENVSDKTVLKHSVIEAAGGAWACGIHNINASPGIQHTNISVRLAGGYNYGIWNDSYATPTINHVDIKVSGIFGSYENLAINNSYSSPIVKNTVGDVLVSSSGSNYGIMNNNESKPELHNVTLNVKNGSTNLQIYNMDALSKIILNATTYTGILNADSAELTQITIKSNAYLLTSMTFQGYSPADAYETTIKVDEPTKANTIRFPDASGTVMLSGGSGGTLDVSSVNANAGTYTEMSVANQITVSKTTVSGDMMLADEYNAISGNTTPADTAFYFGDKYTDGAWRLVRIGTSLVMQRRETGTWVSKMSVNP
jgi:hypothetical protein